jgi:hypothetical protein
LYARKENEVGQEGRLHPKEESAFKRLARRADPHSAENRKLIGAANIAADTLCRRIREDQAPPRSSGKTYLDLVREAISPDESGSRYLYLTDEWILVDHDEFLKLAYEPEPHICKLYGGGSCRTMEAADIIAQDIARSGGGTRWMDSMLQCIVTWCDD